MKKCKIVKLIISIVLGITVGLVIISCTVDGRVLFSNPPLEKMDQGYLKNFAISLAKGEKPVDERIRATYSFKDGWFVVDLVQSVEEIKAAYSLKASFPISEESLELEDGSMRRNFSINYDEGKFNYTNHIRKDSIVLSDILFIVIFSMLFFIVLDEAISAFGKIFKKANI